MSRVYANNEETPLGLSDHAAVTFCVAFLLTMLEEIECRMSTQTMKKRHSAFLTKMQPISA